MKVVEALQRVMDSFDPFHGPTAGAETDDARRRALAAGRPLKGVP